MVNWMKTFFEYFFFRPCYSVVHLGQSEDALISVAVWLTTHRKGQHVAELAQDYLENLTNESLLSLAVMADCADETMQFIRFLDTEEHDMSQVQLQVQTMLSRLHYLVIEQHVKDSGYTDHMVQQLRRPRGFLVRGRPKTVGGLPEGSESPILARILQRMSAWVHLATQTVKAEFPSFELLSSFLLFDIQAPDSSEWQLSKRKACERLAKACRVSHQGLLDEVLTLEPVATQLQIASNGKMTSFDAWRTAVQRTQARKGMAERFPVSNLMPVLVRHGAFSGATTSGVEQFLAKLQANLTPDRSLTVHFLQECKLISDMNNYDDEWLCQQARREWARRWSAPRKFATEPRIHKGIPMAKRQQPDSETAFVRKRRLCGKNAPLKPIQERLVFIYLCFLILMFVCLFCMFCNVPAFFLILIPVAHCNKHGACFALLVEPMAAKDSRYICRGRWIFAANTAAAKRDAISRQKADSEPYPRVLGRRIGGRGRAS